MRYLGIRNKINYMPKILIVEDEEFLSDMYRMRFEQEGYAVVVASDGETGLELVKRERPDLVLLDLVLPGLDGFQVLAKIRKEPNLNKTKVFILSNLGQTDEVDKGLAGGADGYFVKANLTPTQLAEKVNAIFNNQAAAGKKPSQNKPSDQVATETPLPENSAKILLIEDEEAIVNMYKLRFQKSGFAIEAARNGAWGLKLAREKKFDAIILDMVMPAMNGFAALKILKADAGTKAVPVIILSNSAQDKDIAKAKELGAVACLLKSAITPARLVKEVEKIISK